MKPEVFNTPNVPKPNAYIPQAVIANGFIFISGTTGVDPATGKLVEGGFEEQAVRAFKNIQTILEDAGSSIHKTVKITVFMVSGADPDFSMINCTYSKFFTEITPARSAPQVMPFPGNILVSVECIAVM
jgi:2-iminobutanoate/2-iminopropanoate deaminase